jgi:peptidoglycan/LPS O-acetylase OafA/YrhL
MDTWKQRPGNVLSPELTKLERKDTARLPAIDGLRALAVLAVIAFHFNTGLAPSGFVGVDIFFVISGYVITLSLTKYPSVSVAQFLLTFYKHRFLRLMPALVVCLLVVGALSQLFIPDAWLSGGNDKTGRYAFFGMSNLVLLQGHDGYFDVRAAFNPFLHTWSLAVEEQFYLFFPLLLLPWLRQASRDSLFAHLRRNTVLLVGALSLAWAAIETSREPQLAFYLLPSRFWELAAGAVLFQLHSKGHAIPQGLMGMRLTAGLGFLLIAASLIWINVEAFPFPLAIPPVAGTLALISASRSPLSNRLIISRVLTNPLATYLGRASYSLYLWHWPVVVLMQWTIGFETATHLAAALALTFILGLASYHLVERTFLTSTGLYQLPARRVVSVGLVLIAASAILFKVLVKSDLGLSVVSQQAGWHSWDMPAIGSTSPQDAGTSSRTLWVIGDSHASAYTGMVREAAARAGMKVQIMGVSGCSVANLQNPNPDSGACRDRLKESLTGQSQHYARGDIVFLASLRGQRLSDQWGMLKPDELKAILNDDRGDTYRKARDEASEIIGYLRSLGLTVIIDTPKPVFRAPIFRCSDWFNAMNPVCAPGFDIARDELVKIDAPVLNSLRLLKQQYPDLVVWDPFPILCPEERCSVFRHGKPLYFDQDHLSGHGNQLLVESFSGLLGEISAPQQIAERQLP